MKTRKLMTLDEFSHRKRPAYARLSFYLPHAVEDVLETWGLEDSYMSYTDGQCISIIKGCIIKGKSARNYMLCRDLSVKRIISTTYVKNGWYKVDEDVGPYLDSYTTEYELSDTLHQIDCDEDRMSSYAGFESIACEFINVVQDFNA